ncbi:MAG: hypothetical protein A2086_00395 [Spirochaetes bacterium GWD1_27_9]|nr:MAG: hypothetical protein A2Y34_18785 [Spirochaetes bacterium GWC1_27_15]OHD43029.1 MAG: hypothetical protein A2086_00395 [Spirochaetes bacterium GWD1_27_9]
MNDGKPLDIYIEEASELLVKIESLLIELENNNNSPEIVDELFRALHTIKGSGSMFGLDIIASFTHELETIFDLVRKKELQISNQLINYSLKAKDHLEYLLKNIDNTKISPETEELIKAFREFLPKNIESKKDSTETKKTIVKEETKEILNTFRIIFKPITEILLRGVNLNLLLKELSSLGEALITPHYEYSQKFKEINPEFCYFWWTIILTTKKDINDVKDVFIFVEDYCELKIDKIDDFTILEESKKIGEILLEKGDISKEQINDILKENKLFGKLAVEKGYITPDKLQSALDEQAQIQKIRGKQKELESLATIRVKYKKLDDLVNIVGELVTLQAQFTQYSLKNKEPEFVSLTENLERLTSELRDQSMDLRMIPIVDTFNSLYRVVRDISQNLGKEIHFITSGTDTQLDKNIIDKLKDPLVHIVRNSIDHGIELPHEREHKNKPKIGLICVSAYNEGANVVISIKDDGAGLSKEKIWKKAIERGLIKNESLLSDKEIYDLIFLPGFSTAEVTTEVSGRGVGMDIVKKNIESLQGTIEINTEPDKGSEIILRIPLTLAIIDGLLINISEEFYIINLSLVAECIDLKDEVIDKSQGKKIAHLRNEMIPYISLRDLFEIPGEKPAIEQLVIINIENQRIGLVVDNVIGQNQTVIKSIGKVFTAVDEISGASILGDGTLAFVLDVNRIIRKQIKKNMSVII